MSSHKIYTLIGFALKARKCVLGSFAVEQGCRKGNIKLVVLDGASANTVERLTRGDTPYLILQEGKLGDAVGKDVKAAGILDKNFALAIKKEYDALLNADKGEPDIWPK